VLLALLAFALILGLAAAFWTASAAHHERSATPAALHKTTPKPTTAPTPTPTTAPPATATSVPKSPYPNVAGKHDGTVHNTTANIYSNITIALNQHQGNIGGHVTIDPPLQGSGPITSGFVQHNNYIQFTVKGINGNAPLLFSGYVQSGGMSGQYCSIDQSGHCNPNSGGQGTWSVGSVSSSSDAAFFFSNLAFPATGASLCYNRNVLI
jgi:hypothetical protein